MTAARESPLTWTEVFDELCRALGLTYVLTDEPVYWDGGRRRPGVRIFDAGGVFVADCNKVAYVPGGLEDVCQPTLDTAFKLATWALGSKCLAYRSPAVDALYGLYPEFGAPASPAEAAVALAAYGISLGF